MLACITCHSLGLNYPKTVVRMYTTKMIQKIKHIVDNSTDDKRDVVILRDSVAADRDRAHIIIPWGQITLKH